jgi:hypothetical protein
MQMPPVQLSLLDDCSALAGALPAIRAAMRTVAGDPDGDGRKALPDKINAVARKSGLRLTTGNARAISKDTLDKWLSPSDTGHPPSLAALLAFCAATHNDAPLRSMLRGLGLDVMTAEDRKMCDYGRAVIRQKEARKQIKKMEVDL